MNCVPMITELLLSFTYSLSLRFPLIKRMISHQWWHQQTTKQSLKLRKQNGSLLRPTSPFTIFNSQISFIQKCNLLKIGHVLGKQQVKGDTGKLCSNLFLAC